MPNKRTAVQTEAKERRAKVLEMRKAGMTYQEIADHLGISLTVVGRHVRGGIAAWNKMSDRSAKDIVALELARLDRMFFGLWKEAKKGNVKAIDRALRIMERRARLLGLDAPSKIAPTTPDGEEEYSGTGLSSLLAAVEAENQESGA